MTREEALSKLRSNVSEGGLNGIVQCLETLGLIKFEENPEPYKLCSAIQEGKFNIRVEKWPEGFVMWHDGEIVYKSWMK